MDLVKFLFRNLKGYRGLIMLAIIVTVSQVGCDLMTALPLKYIPSKVSNAGNDPACIAPFLNPILDRFDVPQIDPSLVDPFTHQPIPPSDTQCPVSPTDIAAAAHPVVTHHSTMGVIVFSVLMLLVFGSLSAALTYLDLFLASYIAQNLTANLRNRLFDHLQRLSLDWHGKQKKGDLVQRVTGNIADIEKFVTDGLVDLLSGMLTLIGVVTIMLVISPAYTVIALAVSPALFVVVLFYTKNIKAESRKSAKAAGQVADVVTEDINALTVIKVFTREEREALRFGSYVDKNRRAGLKATGLQAQFAPLSEFLVFVGTAFVIGIGGFVAAGRTISVGAIIIPAESVDIGTLVLFLIFLKMLYQPMRDLSKLSNLASSASAGAERIQEVLDQAPEVTDTQGMVAYHGPQKLRGDITFDHVYFGYTPDRPVLRDVTLFIPSGRKVALVGLSGGGKTTLAKLIPRFYEIAPGNGTIRVDGIDSRLYPLHVLRQNVSMVLQDSVLFEGTIRENIAIGKPGASEEEIVDAAKKADIHTMIMTTLGGYERMIREQGKDLSGGQRQRVAIARAILRDAPILILDEPTAALDVESEAEVMHSLNKLIVGRTVITISHRLSTLGNVDEIIVLKDGLVAERGSFRALKRQGGIFANLLDEQNRYSGENAGDSVVAPAFSKNISAISALETRKQASVAAPVGPVVPATPVGLPAKNYAGFGQPPMTPYPVLPPDKEMHSMVFIETEGMVVSEHKLEKPLLTIGRLSSNDISVPNQRVSRLHARIQREGNTWVLEDAESVNGVIYQGNRVPQVVLHTGDRVWLAPGVALVYKEVAPVGAH